ncbi:Serpentine Receptor, class V [Caenorhabditis elegans]|uniref:Serpentine Receptor, class V n=1 Tax=Caenorhabditis elegans TaxID=6239 RepID=P92000_CAEEL|nr:Serpentine Receptor, class V [Caenorhabditis elegans]CAB03130.3 Serpentine Receptor, class V [Caenorhabditis elegans]|eukprot:NP_001343570.1 Serpentine Receptor, class V [Caenorhabditis elegans]
MHHELYDFPLWFFVLEGITLLALLLLTIVSFLLYFIEIQIIFAYRKTTFRGPFYRLMFVGIIVDMLSTINMFTGQVIPARRWFEPFLIYNQSWLGSIFFVITYGGRCIQGATAAILSFCRVCAVCFPIFYHKLGEPWYLHTMQAVQLAGGVIAFVILWPDSYEYILEDNCFYSVGSDDTDADWFYNFVAIMEVVLVLAIIVNNVVTYTMFRLKFNKKSAIKSNSITPSQHQSNQEKQKRENGLDKMTFIVCLVELIYFAFVVYSLQINQYMNKRIFYFLYNILCVIYSTFSAWMLLIISKPINSQVRQRFSNLGGKKLTRSISISVQGSRDNNKS